jgi:hypothetical protein
MLKRSAFPHFCLPPPSLASYHPRNLSNPPPTRQHYHSITLGPHSHSSIAFRIPAGGNCHSPVKFVHGTFRHTHKFYSFSSGSPSVTHKILKFSLAPPPFAFHHHFTNSYKFRWPGTAGFSFFSTIHRNNCDSLFPSLHTLEISSFFCSREAQFPQHSHHLLHLRLCKSFPLIFFFLTTVISIV